MRRSPLLLEPVKKHEDILEPVNKHEGILSPRGVSSLNQYLWCSFGNYRYWTNSGTIVQNVTNMKKWYFKRTNNNIYSYVEGGMGSVSSAISKAAHEAGVHIMTNAEVLYFDLFLQELTCLYLKKVSLTTLHFAYSKKHPFWIIFRQKFVFSWAPDKITMKFDFYSL